jgi:hypothetical protein
MRDIAENDGDKRAVMDIEYIYDTPKGEYFEVDDQAPPIESLIYKIDKTRQKKPLDTIGDEKIVIKYFHRVDNFASDYYKIVDLLIDNKIRPDQAIYEFEKVNVEYKSNQAALFRGMSACFIVAKNPNKAVHFAEQANFISKYDSRTYTLMSLAKYESHNLSSAKNFIDYARKYDPTLSRVLNSWEVQYVYYNEPNSFIKWANKLNVLQFFKLEPIPK